MRESDDFTPIEPWKERNVTGLLVEAEGVGGYQLLEESCLLTPL